MKLEEKAKAALRNVHKEERGRKGGIGDFFSNVSHGN